MDRNHESYSNGNGNGLMGGGNAAARGNRSGGRRQQRAAEEEETLPRPDLLSGPGFNVQRGPRMPRSRRASLDSLAFPGSHVPPLPVAREIDLSKVAYLFKKQLKNSDVGVLRRMILPKKESELHLPILQSKEGIPISMLDMDGIHEWWFKYRYWPNNSSRMYVLEYTGKISCRIGSKSSGVTCTTEDSNPRKSYPMFVILKSSNVVAGEFVYAHGLVTNDFILIYQNVEDGRYIIEARKNGQDITPRVAKNAVANEPSLELSLALPDLPSLDDEDMFYAYDTTFLDDSPFDYVGEAINLPSIGSDSSFEAIDDYNPEDFEFE